MWFPIDRLHIQYIRTRNQVFFLSEWRKENEPFENNL